MVIFTHSGVTHIRMADYKESQAAFNFLTLSPLFLIHIYRYYFVLEESRALAPFTVTVTPCDVPIEWSILVHKASASFLGKAALGKTLGSA